MIFLPNNSVKVPIVFSRNPQFHLFSMKITHCVKFLGSNDIFLYIVSWNYGTKFVKHCYKWHILNLFSNLNNFFTSCHRKPCKSQHSCIGLIANPKPSSKLNKCLLTLFQHSPAPHPPTRKSKLILGMHVEGSCKNNEN